MINFKNTKLIIKNILIVVLIFILMFEIQEFYINYHNVDLAYNFVNIAREINSHSNYEVNITDIGSDYKERNIQNYYISGINGMTEYFMFGLLTMFVLAYLLADKFINERR